MSEFVDRDGKEITMVQWSKLFSDKGYQRLAVDYDADTHTTVSTVWIGASDSIFESMVFLHVYDENDVEIDSDEIMERYTTEAEALAGHAELVAEYITRPALKAELETAGGHAVLLDGAL